jgi:23S rRNA-/tRNA-specific pseudouridylate synthase
MAARDDGETARTDVTVLRRGTDRAHVAARLWTGRTHQIRVHLAHEGHPVLGDPLYAVSEDEARAHLEDGADVRAAAGAPRLALHAAFLGLPHPDGGRLEVASPFPQDLVALMR